MGRGGRASGGAVVSLVRGSRGWKLKFDIVQVFKHAAYVEGNGLLKGRQFITHLLDFLSVLDAKFDNLVLLGLFVELEVVSEYEDLLHGAFDAFLEFISEINHFLSPRDVLLARFGEKFLRKSHETLENILFEFCLLLFCGVNLPI